MQTDLISMYRQRMNELRRRATLVMGQLSEEDLLWRPNQESNSVANLVLHLAGNLNERIMATVGGGAYRRDRDSEFNFREGANKERLIGLVNETWFAVDETAAKLTQEDLGRSVTVAGREVTVADLLFHTATHAAEHIGQILYIAKIRLGQGFQPVSTPHTRR